MNGIINIYKEKGYTSHDVVAKLRGILHIRKIGHTGTLDPDAEGVLPVCIGNATKLCDMLTDKKKQYEAEFKLGIETDTQDISGTVTNNSDNYKELTDDEITEGINSFIGEYEQIPPMYSALKVNGKKLYELAREGIVIDRKARNVIIENIEILDIKNPYIKIRVDCSKGTYIRTLCDDIGKKLNCYATMTSLLRTKSGFFEVENALKLNDVASLFEKGELENKLISPEEMFDGTKVFTKKESDFYLYNGNVLTNDNFNEVTVSNNNNFFKVYDSNKMFKGVYEKKGNLYKPYKMFL